MRTNTLALTSLTMAALSLFLAKPAQASFAQEDESAASGSASTPEDEEPWIRRWRPRGGMTELGIYGGILYLSETHELFEADLSKPAQGWLPLKRLSPDLGVRIGFYPVSFFGIEAEGGLMPSRLDDSIAGVPNANALLYTGRGHLVFQIPAASITPFILGGVGTIGVASDDTALGNDFDFSVHIGGGVKFYLNKYTAIRLDARDIWTMRVDDSNPGDAEQLQAHNLEALLGLSLTLGRPKPPPPPPPAPPAPKDSDKDGYIDPEDECPLDPETFNEFQDEDGCPESDRDGDGFWDEPDQDACPDEPGVEPDGCPIRDTDGDGFLDPDDQCVEEPETRNGYEDTDGCPDEIPKEVEQFMGVIEGIHFETAKATIRPDSETVLDRAVDILKRYPSVRIEISGHTDNVGGYDYNMGLSQERADSVKQYLGEHGIDVSRIETRGAGYNEPRASNDNRRGRALNRRIEFKILDR